MSRPPAVVPPFPFSVYIRTLTALLLFSYTVVSGSNTSLFARTPAAGLVL
jgi:hypothetical protein